MMPPLLCDYTLEEALTLYVAGALTEEEASSIDEALAHGWPEAEGLLPDLFKVAEALAHDCEAVAPPPSIKEGLLRRIEADLLDGYNFKFTDGATDEFRPTTFPGVAVRMLNIDKPNHRFSCLMKVEPGARIPSHKHSGPEECIVLEGTVNVGKVVMRKGDYQRAAADSVHVEQWSDTGALLYLSGPLDLLELGH